MKGLRALQVSDVEQMKLYMLERRRHIEDTDLRESALAKEHNVALEQAAKGRNLLSQESETILRRFYQQQEEELRRKEEEQRRKDEEERLRRQREAEEKAQRDRRIAEERERLRKVEEERVQAERERARAEAERIARENEQARLAEEDRKRKAAEEKKKEAEEEERKKLEAARQLAADQEAQKHAPKSPEILHREYIELYFNLKAWSNNYWEEIRNAAKTRKNPNIKEAIGESRRLIKAEIGKLSSHDRDINRVASEKLKKTLKELLQQTTPVVGKRLPVNNFLPTSLRLDDNDQTTITDMAAYFLTFLTKQVVKIFTSYVHSGPERAEPIGVAVCSIFALPEIQFPRPNATNKQTARQNLFPIFLAKYHRVCPVLFGIASPPEHNQSTATGKRTLGWQLAPAADEDSPKTTFVSEQTHYDRMKGLAIGYSSIALRNFANVTMTNPYPPKHFWTSLAQLVNLPPSVVSPTHICVLRHMFGHGGIGRFLLFFGSVGVAVLREALVEFPARLPAAMRDEYQVKDLVFWVENVLADKDHFRLA